MIVSLFVKMQDLINNLLFRIKHESTFMKKIIIHTTKNESNIKYSHGI